MSPTEFTAAEYAQILETYNDNRRLFIQVVMFLAIANISVIGYAVAEDTYSIFVFGGILMWILFRANIRIAYMNLVVLLRGLSLERQVGVSGLMHYIAAGIKGQPEFIGVVQASGLFDNTSNELAVVARLQEQFKGLSMKYDVQFALSRMMSYVIVGLCLIQFGIGITYFIIR